MIKAKCIKRLQSSGKIIEYTLQDSKGVIKVFASEDLKRAMLNKVIIVSNLKLSQNNRILPDIHSDSDKIETQKTNAVLFKSLDMLNVRDSLQFDSNTTVARYKDGSYIAEINVVGDVRLFFNNEIYEIPSKFPIELKRIIESGNVYSDNRVDVINNNWFELTYGRLNSDYCTTTVDVEGLSKQKIKELCATLISEYKEKERRSFNGSRL